MNEQFLQIFFGPSNLCSIEKIETEGHPQHKILPWVNRIRDEEPKETLLPLIDPKSRNVIWFGLAFTDRQFRRLGEHLSHFLGATYSNFSGIRAEPIPGDTIDEVVNEITGGLYYRFQADNVHIWETLETMRKLWSKKPEYETVSIKSLSRMLRDFHLALQTGNRKLAEKELEHLKQSQFLDSKNLLFLEIELFEAFQQWKEILEMKSFSDIIKMRRPPRVTEAMIKAVYHTYMASSIHNVNQITLKFKEEIFPLYQNLFVSRRNFASLEALTSYMLRAVTAEPQKQEWIDQILQEASSDLELHTLLHKFASTAKKTNKKETVAELSDLSRVQKYVLAGNFEEAFEVLQSFPNSLSRAKLLFDCAYELQTLESEDLALKTYQSLNEEEKEQFLRSRRNKELLAALLSEEIDEDDNVEPSDNLPTNWLSWLEQLNNRSHSENARIAKQGALEWKMFELLEEIPEFKEKLEDCMNDQYKQENLYYSYPHLLEFFKNDDNWPRKELKPIYLSLIEILVLAEGIGEIELAIFHDLLSGVLSVGLTKQEYEDVVHYGIEMWDRAASYTHLCWGIDIVESLILSPCLNEDVRIQFLREIDRHLHVFARFLRDSDWEMIRLLHIDLDELEAWENLKATYPVENEENNNDKPAVWEKLAGKSVGIYTLMERVSERVRNFLEEKVNQIKVHTNNDKAGTDALKIMSRTDDILVVSTASAKHAATLFIQSERPKDMPVIFCNAKGSSSMVRELEYYLEKI